MSSRTGGPPHNGHNVVVLWFVGWRGAKTKQKTCGSGLFGRREAKPNWSRLTRFVRANGGQNKTEKIGLVCFGKGKTKTTKRKLNGFVWVKGS